MYILNVSFSACNSTQCAKLNLTARFRKTKTLSSVIYAIDVNCTYVRQSQQSPKFYSVCHSCM